MKRSITALVALFLAFVLCFFGVYTLNKSCNLLKENLYELENTIKSGNINDIEKKTQETVSIWQKTNCKLESLIKHAETDELEEIIKSLPIYAKTGDLETLFNETNFAIDKLEHIMGNEKISLSNIL